MRCWRSHLSVARWSSWCHCHLIISCSWCQLTQVVMEKKPLNGCLSVYQHYNNDVDGTVYYNQCYHKHEQTWSNCWVTRAWSSSGSSTPSLHHKKQTPSETNSISVSLETNSISVSQEHSSKENDSGRVITRHRLCSSSQCIHLLNCSASDSLTRKWSRSCHFVLLT